MRFPQKYIPFLFILLFQSVGLFALNYHDLYDEKDQLLEIRDPPFFDYEYEYCWWHWLNANVNKSETEKPSYTYHPSSLIPTTAREGLSDALKVYYYGLNVPPPYYWKGIKSYKNQEKWMGSWKVSFFDRCSENYTRPSNSRYSCLRYSEYSQKYDYLYYWFDLCYNLEEQRIKNKISDQKEEVKKAEEQGKEGYYYVQDIRDRIAYLERTLGDLKIYRKESFYYLHSSLEEVSKLFMQLYSECISSDTHPTSLYERGRIHYEQGNTTEFIRDVSMLLESEDIESSSLLCNLGKAYNDVNHYNQAIKILSEAIKNDPANKDAYFERAIAYFETGNLDLALADYIISGIHPTQLDPNNPLHAQLLNISMGLARGCFQGGTDSALDFVPCLLSTIYGLGKGLWAVTSDPLGISKELVEGCRNCIEYAKDNISPELLAKIVPELRECIEQWDEFDEETKGYYMGYVVGRFGVDMLAFGGTIRGVKLIRDLKKANSVLTLEKGYLSTKSMREVKVASEEYYIAREAFKKKCKLHVDKQGKHVPAAHNFIPGRSELTISIQELEEMATAKLGDGIPQMCSFGKANYRELVDFGKEIGIDIAEKSKIRTPTTIGEIHYDANAGYHIVPVHPRRFIE